MRRTNRRTTYTDGGYVDLDEEVLIDPSTGERITEADADRLADEAERSGPGRPSLGASGTSPVVSYRIAPATKNRLAEFSKRSNRKASDVARDALEEYLARHDV